MSAAHILITDDGRLIAFNPSDYKYIVNQKDLEEGKYDLKQEIIKQEGDTVTMRFSQLMPPLVKVRGD